MPVYMVERSLPGIAMEQLAAAQKAAIQTSDLAHFNAAALMWPIFQKRIEVQTHRNQTSNTSPCLVNKS